MAAQLTQQPRQSEARAGGAGCGEEFHDVFLAQYRADRATLRTLNKRGHHNSVHPYVLAVG